MVNDGNRWVLGEICQALNMLIPGLCAEMQGVKIQCKTSRRVKHAHDLNSRKVTVYFVRFMRVRNLNDLEHGTLQGLHDLFLPIALCLETAGQMHIGPDNDSKLLQ